MLKSPSNNIVFFSLLILSRVGRRNYLLNSSIDMEGCLYIHPII